MSPAPAWIAVGLAVAAVVLSAWPRLAGAAAALGIAAALAVFRFAGRWLDRPIERVYAAVCVLAGAAWLTLAIGTDEPVGAAIVLVLGTVALAVPYWRHRAPHSRVATTPGLRGRRAREQEAHGYLLIDTWETAADRAKLEGSRVLRVSFPSVSSWVLHLELAGGDTVADVRRAAPALESVLKLPVGSVEVEPVRTDASRVDVRLATDATVLDDAVPWSGDLSPVSILDELTLGRFRDGELVRLCLAFVHVLIGGMSGSGKSGVLNLLVAWYARCRDVVLWGVDLKRGAELGPWRPVLARIARTVEEAEDLLEAAGRVLEARGDLCFERGIRKWKPSPAEPMLVIVIDEHAALSMSERATVAMAKLAEQGRAFGVLVVTALQKPLQGAFGPAKHGGNRIANNLQVKICLLVDRAAEARVVLGEDATKDGWRAESIDVGAGGFYLRFLPAFKRPRLARAEEITDSQVAATAAALAATQPALDSASTTAAERDAPRSGSGPAVMTPPAASPTDSTAPVELFDVEDLDGGGELVDAGETPEALLERLLAGASADGRHWSELAERTGRGRSWVYRELGRLDAVQVTVGYWRARRADDAPAAGESGR